LRPGALVELREVSIVNEVSVMNERGTILIVDDERVVFESLELFLEDKHDLIYADSGSSGLLMARTERVDLILLDIGMPDINGYELCRMLKSDPETEDIPVIFLTAFSSSNDEAVGLEAGAVDYIAKPINPPIVRARVKSQMTLKLQRDYLELLVRQDSLTSLVNRRGFDELFSREWRRAARARKPLSLIMMDIDSFKLYNDHYGHVAGDHCLQQISAGLGEVLHRGGDYLVRYGGEEFVAVLADTPFEFVGLMAERLRAAVEAMQIPHACSIVKNVVTISVGAATIVPIHSDSPSTLLMEADRMLYEVKKAGRNATLAADMGGPEEVPPLAAAAT